MFQYMKILVTGSHGLVGKPLVSALKKGGHEVFTLASKPYPGESNCFSFEELEKSGLNFDACINLAGENISEGRWTVNKKKKIRDSRVENTARVAKFLAHQNPPLKVMISASAIGFYGSRGEETLNESSSSGNGFLASVCVDWEKACKPLVDAGARVVYLRTGVVLSSKGGALAKMITPFKFGLGGVIGSGKQYVSWIALDDLVSAILFLLDNDQIQGAVNAVSPNPVTNQELTKTLAGALHRPAFFPLPAFAARLILGEMADELLLSSTKVKPGVLEFFRFPFKYPNLPCAITHALEE